MTTSPQRTTKSAQDSYLYPTHHNGTAVNQWRGGSQQLDTVQVHPVPTSASPLVIVATQTPEMADKGLKEFGTDVCHGRSDTSQSSTPSNSNYGYRKQQKSKGSLYSSKGQSWKLVYYSPSRCVCVLSLFISFHTDKKGYDRYPSHPGKVLQPRNGVYRPQPPKQSGRGSLCDHRSSNRRYGQSQKEGMKIKVSDAIPDTAHVCHMSKHTHTSVYTSYNQQRNVLDYTLHSTQNSPTSDSLVENGGQQGGKKKPTTTSLNHLLNFTIAPAERR